MSNIKKLYVDNLAVIKTVEKVYPVNAPDGTPALNIEGIKLKNLNYPIIVQKNLYKSGDMICYIKWDSCLPNTDLFNQFIAPDGDVKKSILASHNRVRVVKLIGNHSFGIILSLQEIKNHIDKNISFIDELDLTKELGLFKTEIIYDDILIKGKLPSFLYATDEANIFDCDSYETSYKDKINALYASDKEIQITVKRDGGSTTLYDNGVCARTVELKKIFSLNDLDFDTKFEIVKSKLENTKLNNNLTIKTISKLEFEEFIKDEDIWVKRGEENKKNVLQKYTLYQKIVNNEIESIRKEIIDFPIKLKLDPIIEAINDHNYLNKFLEWSKKQRTSYVLRGECLGYNKGGGNKNNPDKKNRKIVFFGLDEIKNGIAEKVPTNSKINLYSVCDELGFEATPIIYRGLMSYSDIISFGEKFFKDNLVEGLVIRTVNSNELSVKYINSKYDI